MKKKLLVVVILSFIISLVSEGILWYLTPAKAVGVQLPEDAELMYPAMEYYTSGYDFVGSSYIPNNEDPQFGFILPGKEIENIIIYFENPLEEDTPINTYYAVNQEALSEAKIAKQSFEKGTGVAVIQLPHDVYTHIRLDIERSFSLREIYLCKSRAITQYQRSPYNVLRAVIMWFLLFASACVLFKIIPFDPASPTASKYLFIYKKGSERIRKSGIFVLIIVVGACVFIGIQESIPEQFLAFTGGEAFQEYLTIEDDKPIKQVFSPTVDEISKVKVLLGTFIRVNHFQLRMELSCMESGEILQVVDIDTAKLIDNAYADISFPGVRVDRDKSYSISFIAEGTDAANSVAFYKAKGPVDGQTVYAANDKEIQTYNLAIQVYGKDIRVVRMIDCIVAMLFIYLLVFFYLKKTDCLKVEKMFVFVALPLGIFYMLIMTPLSAPDEMTHYETAYKLSNYITSEVLSKDYVNRADLDYSDLAVHENVLSGYQRVAAEFCTPAKELEMVTISRSIAYPLHYLPQALGITVARLFNRNFVITFLMGRFFNLLFYIICLYFAINRTPIFQCLFVLIGIMPMAIHQAASYSYDAFVIGMAMILIACILKGIYEEGKISRSDLLWILISGMLLAPAKIVYLPILLLTLLVPAERYNSKKEKYIATLCLFAASIVMAFVFQNGAVERMASDTSLNWEGQHNYSISFVLQNPVETIHIFLQTLYSQIETWFFMMFGSHLSGLTLSVPRWIIEGFVVIIFFSTLNIEKDDYQLKKGVRFSFLAVFAVITVLIMMSMFLGWTSDTRDTIQGIQGRYFIPVLPLLAISMNNQVLVFRKRVDNMLLSAALLLQTATILHIINTTLRT